MKKVLIVVDHFPVSPRVIKMKKTYESCFHEVDILAWNRGSSDNNEHDIITHDDESGYGNPIRKIANIFKFGVTLRNLMKKKNYHTVHLIDFEMLLIYRLLGYKNKETQSVYEVYDLKIIDNMGGIEFIRSKVEKVCMRKLNIIVFASPFFHKYYNSKSIPTYSSTVINNRPLGTDFSNINTNYIENYRIKLLAEKKVITFAGSVRYFEDLCELIRLSENFPNILILICGRGIVLERLRDYLQRNEYKHVIITGEYSTEDLHSIYSNSDYIFAAYPVESLNVHYAVSNKFFESELYSKPIIVSSDTLLAEEVITHNKGLVVNMKSEHSILDMLRQISSSDNMKISNTDSKIFWEDEVTEFIEMLEGV